jgi:hypothetical protein
MIARELKGGHRPLGRGRGPRTSADELLRILRQLMHVDDVRKGAKDVKRCERPLALLSNLDAEQKVGCDADEHDVVD